MKGLNDYTNARLPSRTEAVRIACAYLQERVHNGSNPRIIYEHGVHVFNVAKIAATIARHTPDLNPDIAYVLGLLHDIGRVKDETVTGVPHTIEGYEYLNKLGWPDIAAICVTHNFIEKNINPADFPTYTTENLSRAQGILNQIEFNDYDRLLQLSDLFSRGKEILSISQRLEKNKKFYKINSMNYECKAYRLLENFNRKYNIDVEKIVMQTFINRKPEPAVYLYNPFSELYKKVALSLSKKAGYI